MPTAKINGVELYYEVTGAGERLVLTHGSWGDGDSWSAVAEALVDQFEVVTWDRRGHTRSQAGSGPGSRTEDAADLAALIEHLGGGPVHLAGNSYGSIVTLTLVTERPDLIASASIHEPPLMSLLEGTTDPEITRQLTQVNRQFESVLALIESGQHRAAAEHFIDHVGIGPGSWENFPEEQKHVLEKNAPTFLDEGRDPTALSIDAAELASTTKPLLITRGDQSPVWFSPIIDELSLLVPDARVATIPGAGHVPHSSHPELWVETFLEFQDEIASKSPAGASTDD